MTLEGLAEADFQQMIGEMPDLIPEFRGKTLHREVDAGGSQIDFAYEDGSFHRLVEMKYRQPPENAIHDLVRKAPDYMADHRLRPDQVVLMILVDRPTAVEHERQLRFAETQFGIQVILYDPDEIYRKYQEATKKRIIVGRTIEVPSADRIGDLQNDLTQLRGLFPLLRVLKAAGGKAGYFRPYRDFVSGGLGKDVITAVASGNIDDALWLCFLRAATNSDTASKKIHDDGWTWEQIHGDPRGFDDYFGRERARIKFRTSAAWDRNEFTKMVATYVEAVKGSPLSFFREHLKEAGNYWDGYSNAYNAILKQVHKFGDWKTKIMFRWIEWYRVLPIEGHSPRAEKGTRAGLAIIYGKELNQKDAESRVREIAERLGISPMDVDLALWIIAGEETREGVETAEDDSETVLGSLPRVTQEELAGLPDGRTVVCAADPNQGIGFLTEHTAWGFPALRETPLYFALYLADPVKAIRVFGKVASVEDPLSSRIPEVRTLSEDEDFSPGKRVLIFEQGSLRRIEPGIPLGPSRAAIRTFEYTNLRKLSAAKSVDDL